jgi:adenylate cyclase class IV
MSGFKGDLADRANDTIERELEAKLKQQRALFESSKLQHTGLCHYCEDEVTSPNIFCDEYCRDMHDKHELARVRKNGDRN